MKQEIPAVLLASTLIISSCNKEEASQSEAMVDDFPMRPAVSEQEKLGDEIIVCVREASDAFESLNDDSVEATAKTLDMLGKRITAADKKLRLLDSPYTDEIEDFERKLASEMAGLDGSASAMSPLDRENNRAMKQAFGDFLIRVSGAKDTFVRDFRINMDKKADE